MKNKLELLDTVEGWIAVFTGVTGSDEKVTEEVAHNIKGDSQEDRISNALMVWGADPDETNVTIK